MGHAVLGAGVREGLSDVETSRLRARRLCKGQGPEGGYVSRAAGRSWACSRVCTGHTAREQRGQGTQALQAEAVFGFSFE